MTDSAQPDVKLATPGRPGLLCDLGCVMVLAGLVLAMFADVLFGRAGLVLSEFGTDLSTQFVHWRAFGFGALADGDLALWNPHIFCGMPYFAGFQSALLYPPNWLFCVLPLARAVNTGIALHVFLGGLFVYAWVRHRGLHPLAGLLGAGMFMFGGTHFLHIYAGHLPNLCSMVWTPLVLLAVDGLAGVGNAAGRRRPAAWVCLGTFAVAMQVFAGHPQYVFYTGVAASLYALLLIVAGTERVSLGLGFVAIYALGAALAGVQLLPGIAGTAETVRGAGLSYEFAAMFSFPPENLLTLLVPHLFGDIAGLSYWGRCYLWEMSLFASVTGLVLAVHGRCGDDSRLRPFCLTMCCALFVLALGSHTPLFRLLFAFVPGFDLFRGNSKFVYPMSLFVIMLAAVGMHRVVAERWNSRRPVLSTGVLAVLVATAALVVWREAVSADGGLWAKALGWIHATQESYLPAANTIDGAFVRRTGVAAAVGLGITATTLAGVAALFAARARFSQASYVMLGLALLELFVFARLNRPTFELRAAQSPEVLAFLETRPGDHRVLNLVNHNLAMTAGAYDLWGYDPGVLRRYAELIAFSQDQLGEKASQYVTFRTVPELYRMLRCRYVLTPGKDGPRTLHAPAPLPRFSIVHQALVLTERDRIFDVLAQSGFDPAETVILEQSPEPPPRARNGPENVRLVAASTDHAIIEAELNAPGILLVTDAYSDGWRARADGRSGQDRYRILPANYALQAIPLAAGNHRIRLEYVPPGFHVGLAASVVAGLAWLALAGTAVWRRGT